jgi:hypothetical protein
MGMESRARVFYTQRPHPFGVRLIIQQRVIVAHFMGMIGFDIA